MVKLSHPPHRIGELKITRRLGSARNNHLYRAENSGRDQQQGGPRESGWDSRWSGKKGRAGCSIK